MTIADDQQTAEEAANARGTRVAADWRGGIDSLMRVSIGLRAGVIAFKDDRVLLNAFLAPLVDGGFLTANDALLGPSSPKISMLMQIAEHEHLLARPEVARHLSGGFTIIYQACSIFKKLPGDDQQKTDELVRILAECPEDGAREHLLAVSRRIKRAAKPGKALDQPPSSTQGVTPNIALRDLLKSDQRFDLVLITPDEALPLLDAEYPPGGQEESVLERCLPVYQLVSDDAAVVVVTRLCDLPVVANRLLGLCGFGRLSRILRLDDLRPLDVTDGRVIVLATRGRRRITLPKALAAADPMAIAAELFPDATSRLHLFAQEQSPGWTSVVGDHTWLERPTL